MCDGGNVRSVGLKFLLNEKYGHEAIACGRAANSAETIDFLCNWADYILVVTPAHMDNVPQKHLAKAFVYNIGEDRFGYAFHPELITLCDKLIQEHGMFV